LAWLAVSSLVTFAYLTVVGLIPTAPGLLFIAYMLRIFVVLTVLMFSMSFFHRFLNRSTRVWRQLAANSYNVYLIHMVPQVLFQFLVLRWPISPLLKFGAVSVLTLILSYGASRFVVRKSTYAAILVLVLLFLIMCLFF
jgi:peptidoglycan/LPS O-acetylase OafA/YrhL